MTLTTSSASHPPTGLTATPHDNPATPWSRIAQLAVLLTVVVGVLVSAFAWTATSTAPRSVPVGLVGPEAATSQLGRALEDAAPGAFDLIAFADDAAARTAIGAREIYGAVVVGERGATVLTASGASPVVAQLLDGVATSLSEQMLVAAGGTPSPQLVQVEDVVPISVDDARGAAFTSSILPLSLGGIIMGAASVLLVTGLRGKAVFLAAASIGAGFAVALVAGPWLGVLPGSVWAIGSVAALSLAAVSTAIAGVAAVVGPRGIAIVGAVTMVLGNPLSAASSAPQMLPEGWSTLGQLLPPGAAATALRSVAYFDGAGAWGAIAALTGWVAVGAVLLPIGLRRRERRAA